MQSSTGTIGGMSKMISVKSMLYDIYEMLPNVEMQEEDRIIELIMQASSKLYNHKYYERVVCLRVVEDYIANMSSDYIAIRSVLGIPYNYDSNSVINNMTTDANNANNLVHLTAGVSSVDTSLTQNVNVDYNYNIDLKTSTTIKQLVNNHSGWKYLYPGVSIINKLQHEISRLNESGCIDVPRETIKYCNRCNHLFSVDTLGRLVTTIHTGLVLIEYIRLPKDENGDLLIPYHHDIQDAINAYVLYKLNAKSFSAGREGAQSRMQYWQQQWQMYYLNVKNSLLMPSLSEQIHAIKNRDMFSKDANTIFSDAVMNPTTYF